MNMPGTAPEAHAEDQPGEDLTRLRPPFRGDLLAGGLLAAAALLFITAIVVLTAKGLIVWDAGASLLGMLNYFSLTLTVAAFIWSGLKDFHWLRGEEKDITWLLGKEGRRNPRGVLYRHRRLSDDPKVLRVETLVDDRVMRVLGPTPESAPGPVRESELRAVAAWRSAGLGTFARYSSGLLLLLTVLGTFVGVKFSLGPLQEAVRSGAEPTALAEPLKNVALAFGSNLTALVGAIAIGLASFGLSVGRQNMLARLEQASFYVYRKVRKGGASDPLAEALTSLGDASRGLAGIAEDLGGLGDRIDGLTETVTESMAEMRRALVAVVEEQPLRLAQQSQQAVDRIERQITDTVTAVQHATALYGTLVERLETQQDSLAVSTRILGAAVDELKRSREVFGTYADSATGKLDARLAQLEVSSGKQVEASATLVERYQSIGANLDALLPQVKALIEQLGTSERGQRAAFLALEQRIGEHLVQRLTPLTHLTEAVSGLQDAMSALPVRLQTEFRPVVTVSQPQPPAGDGSLLPVLRQLAQALERAERRRSEPWWQRVLGRSTGRP